MTKKILLWTGFVLGIVIVAFPSLMLVERIRAFREPKSGQPAAVKEEPAKPAQPASPAPRENTPSAPAEKPEYPSVTANGVIFTYDAPDAKKVFVAGTFNNWDGKKGVMAKQSGGTWETVLKIKPGRYTYKFKADGVWFTDPQNPVSADDGKGGRVSVLMVE